MTKKGHLKDKPKSKAFEYFTSLEQKENSQPDVEVSDLFEPVKHKRPPRKDRTRPDTIMILGGVEKLAHDIQVLRLEWAIKYPTMNPVEYLQDIKGYNIAQAHRILGHSPKDEWYLEKNNILDKMTESVVKRHIDLIAEVQETHIKASKVGLAKAIEYLAKLSVDPAKDENGKIIMDGNGRPVWRGYRSVDLVNIMSSIEKAQVIYRRAMGLGNDEGGMAQILEKINQLNVQQNVQENHLHIHQAPQSELSNQVEQKMSYEDLLEFIEFRREQKKKREEEEAKVD